MFHKMVNSMLWVCVAIVFLTMWINVLIYPDCNRENRECFLVQHVWGEKSELMQVADKGRW